ncbi:MAG: hypothetical protein ACRBBW_21455 [Cellvibrionaceae bacterium]
MTKVQTAFTLSPPVNIDTATPPFMHRDHSITSGALTAQALKSFADFSDDTDVRSSTEQC